MIDPSATGAKRGEPGRGRVVDPELLSRIQNALTALESDSGTAASAGALLRATREAVTALRERRSRAANPGPIAGHRALVHRILEGAAKRPVRLAFHSSPFAEEWTDLVLEAVAVSDYTVGPLFFTRARELGDRTLFLLPPGRKTARISWAEAETRVLEIGRALLALRERDDPRPVALLGPNSPEIALFDLACLVTGTPNIPIPANSPPDQVDFIRKHSGARSLFLGDEIAAEAAREAIDAADSPLRVHWLEERRPASQSIRSFADFLAAGQDLDPDRVRQAASEIASSDLATTMYTSGTTGVPKGIPFNHGNLVTKRFARAAAWPDLGEGDVFLCYLPLYHTFGRWLEMLGCVFWGSIYAFLDDVSVDSMMYSFRWVRPTTFISVPKKWIQIAESVGPIAEDDEPESEDQKVSRALVEATGGRLRRGLSAAGYLPASVFRRFHKAGIELHSGFGMTEATGGITMTPPGGYRNDSIGQALPGIELRVADDGELLIRGPYVTNSPPEDPPREDGWFATGDIVTEDSKGHLRIVDRKKEIFKNVQGETISPRRIESLFADFDIVERVLVIGDSQDYCTALIVPSGELREEYATDELTIDSPDLRDFFAPVVSTVNRFLAPFERIVDFAVLSRDLDPERGELTAKGTPKRKLVRERFEEAIRPMYSQDQVELSVGNVEVKIPHWFFRQIGVPASQIRATETGLTFPSLGRTLPIRRRAGRSGLIVGDLEYDPGGEELLLGNIFGRAELWIGNEAVRAFAGSGIEHWWRRGRRFRVQTHLPERPLASPENVPPLASPLKKDAVLRVAHLHELARTLTHPDPDARRAAIEVLREGLSGSRSELTSVIHQVLVTALADREIRAEAFRTLMPSLSPAELEDLLVRHLEDPKFLVGAELETISRQGLRGDQLKAVIEHVREPSRRLTEPEWKRLGIDRLLELLVHQAINHPRNYHEIRSLLVLLGDEAADGNLRRRFEELWEELVTGFRQARPPLKTVAGVSWDDAVEFRGEIPPQRRTQILSALSKTRLLPEAMALLRRDMKTGLKPLVRHSIRVTFLGAGTGRAVHLLEWAAGGLDDRPPRFECVLKVNEDLEWSDIERELRLLVRARTGPSGRAVVKTLGGGYREYGLWTEEFVPGRTLDELVEHLLEEEGYSQGVTSGRLPELWQFIVSSSTSLLVDFWRRTGRSVALGNPSPQKIVLPPHDWQVGRRLVSIANRVPCRRLTDVLKSARHGIVDRFEDRISQSELGPVWRLLFSAALEVMGEEEGLAILEREEAEIRRSVEDERQEDGTAGAETLGAAIHRFTSSVRRRGFMPFRIRIAARRYRRWAQLNPQATLEARAETLDQIESAYGLSDLDRERAGSRLQFFRHTVFRRSPNEFTRELDNVIAKTRVEAPTKAEWHAQVTALKESFSPTEEEEFFLARMLYPHLDPRGKAILVREEDDPAGFATGVVVELRDREGEIFRIRRPANPNEVSALYRVFRRSNFRSVYTPGQDLLVVTNENGRVIGGLTFQRMSETYVQLEWVVVSRHRLGRGIGTMLVREFLQRLAAQGVRVVSTGFFRPSFFAKLGFGVDPRYAGVVRTLEAETASGPVAAVDSEG